MKRKKKQARKDWLRSLNERKPAPDQTPKAGLRGFPKPSPKREPRKFVVSIEGVPGKDSFVTGRLMDEAYDPATANRDLLYDALVKCAAMDLQELDRLGRLAEARLSEADFSAFRRELKGRIALAERLRADADEARRAKLREALRASSGAGR